ncbi:MAG TPA: 4-hydroxy-tetrahydrodipicolinate synthase [Pseudogracilibacillus sp.]|nr:4-hydroxy-tetrahydrodipicolinate synthase [Pseudogracilibacillus sp.]
MNFGQVVTAMVTPFDEEGNIDYPATTQLLNHLINNGTDSVVVAGTTGESPTLSTEEKIALFSYVVKEVNGRIPVIAGTGTNNTRESIALTKEAENCGVDGIMLVSPYYNKPCQEGLYQHFSTIAGATSLPVMIYNIPGRTACNIDVETTIRLSKVENIVCTKEASADLDAMAAIIEGTDDDFVLYSGDDSLTLPVLAIGGVGVVSVSAHIVGNEMQEMINTFNMGNVKEAAAKHRKLLPVFKSLFSAPSPTPLKAVLNMNGISVGDVRLPLVPLSDEQLQQLKKEIQLTLTKAS